MNLVIRLLGAEGLASQFKRRFKEQGIPVTHQEAYELAVGLTWMRIPYSRANDQERPEDALPYIYDYEMLAVKALKDEAALGGPL